MSPPSSGADLLQSKVLGVYLNAGAALQAVSVLCSIRMCVCASEMQF